MPSEQLSTDFQIGNNIVINNHITIIFVTPFLSFFLFVPQLLNLDEHSFTLAYYNDIVVGAVCCRVDKSDNGRRLYIMTLGCLAPYRRLGIGKVLLFS